MAQAGRFLSADGAPSHARLAGRPTWPERTPCRSALQARPLPGAPARFVRRERVSGSGGSTSGAPRASSPEQGGGVGVARHGLILGPFACAGIDATGFVAWTVVRATARRAERAHSALGGHEASAYSHAPEDRHAHAEPAERRIWASVSGAPGTSRPPSTRGGGAERSPASAAQRSRPENAPTSVSEEPSCMSGAHSLTRPCGSLVR